MRLFATSPPSLQCVVRRVGNMSKKTTFAVLATLAVVLAVVSAVVRTQLVKFPSVNIGNSLHPLPLHSVLQPLFLAQCGVALIFFLLCSYGGRREATEHVQRGMVPVVVLSRFLLSVAVI